LTLHNLLQHSSCLIILTTHLCRKTYI